MNESYVLYSTKFQGFMMPGGGYGSDWTAAEFFTEMAAGKRIRLHQQGGRAIVLLPISRKTLEWIVDDKR